MILKKLIQEIEEHTGQAFDLNNKRHFLHLNGKIKRLNQSRLRKLSVIERVLSSENGDDSIFNSKTHYIVKKR